jgi:hypothetical protein
VSNIPITQDSTVLDRLYRRFDCLQDLPCELRGCCVDEAVNLGFLEADSFLGCLMAYEVEESVPIQDHFVFLSREDNLRIDHYRHIRPVEFWPQPIIGVTFDNESTGRTTGTHRVEVMLKESGNVQLWWGQEIAVIWEAYLGDGLRPVFDHRPQQFQEFEALMNQMWNSIEQYLQDQGVKQIYTDAADPEFDPEWFRCFLIRRGYNLYPQQRCKREILRKSI